ncbi:3-oxo-tetronate kinase [Xenorhabdus sp. PB30.3]|uniref:3-oxo-tetronate kinase n=1 Tax=Xenorhabdus sp. PB30.3 TaxID=2788941 RepID=UPI001E372825|nr:3-oxo-tetronate kinase [Xenorhabdus sp. PB30.3]MCC8379221.1 four-carbon acid sugar kinase family protein [Xenorhabdus sp. PB30.3]
MTIKLGVIADDFTGATDIASFMVQNGWRVVLLFSIPDNRTFIPHDVDAIVISLKIRSCPVEEALEQSLKACEWLRKIACCSRFFFKYCSTFDSTKEGNIGPVIDVLMDELQIDLCLICPALPINGRTVVHGYLFVNGQLLNESDMQYHPINPMKDSNLLRLIEQQSKGFAGLVDINCVRQGELSIREHLHKLRCKGARYAVVDTLLMDDLLLIAKAIPDMAFVTGGSGLGGAIARYYTGHSPKKTSSMKTLPSIRNKKAVILSGSCSTMTYQQVTKYQKEAPTMALDIDECINNSDYVHLLVDWVIQQPIKGLAPMLYSTQPPGVLKLIQEKHRFLQLSKIIEQIFAQIANELRKRGFNTFILTGGETSGRVVQSLGIRQVEVGAVIALGVPWVYDLHSDCWLALKSGNFGEVDFFYHSQKIFH